MPFAEPDRARHVDVNRTRLRVWEWGDPADPVVICAHGAYDHGRMFDQLAPMVAALGFHVLAVDLRGHGDSEGLNTGLTFEASVLDLGVLARRQGAPVGLLGHSMGAGMLFNVAAVWPESVRWVVSLDGLGPPSSEIDGNALDEAAAAAWPALLKALGRDRRVFPDAEAMRRQRGAINTRMPEPWLHHLVEHGSFAVDGGRCWKWDPLFNTFLPDGFNSSWVTEDYRQVVCPVLALMGGADDMWSFPADELEERSSHLADVRIEVIDDAGHYVHLEQPDAVITHIRRFIDEVGQ